MNMSLFQKYSYQRLMRYREAYYNYNGSALFFLDDIYSINSYLSHSQLVTCAKFLLFQ